jgi:DHA2 family multidrug resistance protein
LNSRTNLHFERLASHLNSANPALGPLLQHSSAAASALSGDPIHGHAIALKELWQLTLREAQTQAYADAFLAITIAFVIATLMVPLMRKVVAPAAPPAEAH